MPRKFMLYLKDESLIAFNKLKDFGMDIQVICRKALIEQAEILELAELFDRDDRQNDNN